MHAPLQVERKMAPGEGLFSLRLPRFESYQAGILNSPTNHDGALGSRFSNFRLRDPETGSTMARDRFEGEIGASVGDE
jgi:hypothetical protein